MLGMEKSIFRRLLFSYLITVLLGLGVSGFLMSLFAKNYFYDSKQTELLRKAKKVNAAILENPHVSKEMTDQLLFLDEAFDARIWIFDEDGKIVATSMKDEVYIGLSVANSIVKQVLSGQNAITELQIEGLDDPMLSVAVPWGEGDQVYGGIVLHAPIVGIERTISQMRETILWATLFGVLLSTAMVSYLSWSISRPLQKIERTTAEIGRGNYSERVSVNTQDEIADLAQTINKMAEKLEKVEQERRHLEQVRNDFLANLSHELRTPLTAMQGFLEALQDGLVEDEESRRKYYDVLYNETMQVTRLVDDLMDLMKLENNEMTLSKFPVDIGEVINKVVFALQPEAEEKQNVIQVEIPAEVPRLYADKDRIAQIFKNLLKNAIKFTQGGTIHIGVTHNPQWIEVTVADTGIGIDAADLPRIWERFFKVDRGRSKKDGTGLGLSIVKELVELHNGTISVQSTPGQGTTFIVTLPTISQVAAKSQD